MVRVLDLKSGGFGFKSSSLPLDGFVSGGPEIQLLYVNSQLVSLQPVQIFNKFSVLFIVFDSYFIVSPISTTVLNTITISILFYLLN